VINNLGQEGDVARWREWFRRTPDVSKAISPATTPAATFTAQQVASIANAAARGGQQVTGVATPLPRTDPQVAFGPGVPLFPAAIDPPRPDTGRPEPRFNEYPVTSNLPGVGDRLVPWKVLRDAADAGGLPRRCIEIRKSEVTTLDWAITISKQAVEAAQDGTNRPRSEIEQELRERLSPQIVRCTRFWEKPDPGQDEDFAEWLSKLLEEHLVLDAVAIYPRLTYGGDLYALEILDASTIKPLRDHRGGRPAPPQPAFQQILWGFPRGEFVADIDAEGNIIGALPADQLVYKRRNVRAHTPYGYSAVEQALEDVDVWLRRRKWIRDEYTEGTVPTGWLKNVTGQTSWTPAQVREYETDVNDTYSGGTSARHRLRVLPPGFDFGESKGDVAERYKPEYDLFLVKQIAAHFDVTIAELGFTETGGLGSTGWHEGQADVQQRKGTLPTLRWLQQLLTSISRKHLGMPGELEFTFLGLEEEDAAAADEVAAARVSDGRMTYNEDRDRMGMPRFDFPEADMPMVKTARGLVFLAGASELAPAGEVVGPVQGPPQADADADGVLDAPHGPDTAVAGKPGNGDQTEGEDNGGGRAETVKTELAAYRRWARRNPTPGRPFTFQTVTKADAPDLLGAPVVFATPGGDSGGPKGEPVAWPGWDRDQDTATAWAARTRLLLTQDVNCGQLAEQWLAQELVKADEPDPTTAETYQQPPQDDGTSEWAIAMAAAFLAAQGIAFTTPLAAALAGIWAEGWAIGNTAARAILAGKQRARFGWTIGDDEAARHTLTTAMTGALQAFLDQNDSTVHTIADRRLHAFARVLADAKARGLTAQQLAQALRETLQDDAWARKVALTELTRASAQAARTVYTAEGITTWRWATEPGACPICTANEAAGTRTIGEMWPDGSEAPPAHPHCRCYPIPA
jgi:hypothetical protein